MAQYQILARKPSGHSGQARKSKESKNSVATPPRDRRTAAARRRPPPAQRAAHCRTLHVARPAIGTVAARSYSAAVRTLQCRRAHATVPPCFFFYFEDSKSMQFRHNYVLIDPSLGSDTTVGTVTDPDPVPGGAAEVSKFAPETFNT
ncbi:pentatricopeptide repeat-containing protein mitochondrial-like [Dorcoceras hygrometricum]|uniref:Pentatricopeptide repeat-containing protein mitochondrial-like n=1 Tax=Dorcoceras hygrometricum TaxID=472368 RepID=A0A2Z7A5B0_9LAMI|nr:pentatricopeptide repeat-containing protein mitochondrial-like [Dorcoceras hygrometricum]